MLMAQVPTMICAATGPRGTELPAGVEVCWGWFGVLRGLVWFGLLQFGGAGGGTPGFGKLSWPCATEHPPPHQAISAVE